MGVVPNGQSKSRRTSKAAGLEQKAAHLRDLQQVLRAVHKTVHAQCSNDIAESMQSLHAALAPLPHSLPPLRSLVRDILQRLKLPTPAKERHRVKRQVLDFAYVDVKLCIRFRGDHRCDRALIREGWRVIRYAEEVIRKAPHEFGALVETNYGLLRARITSLAQKPSA